MFGSHQNGDAAVQVIFDLYDTDASGGLDLVELEDYLLAVHMMSEAMKDGHTSDAELAELAHSCATEMLTVMDTDKDGVVSPAEFRAWIARNAQVAGELDAANAETHTDEGKAEADLSSVSFKLPEEGTTLASQTCWADLRAMNTLFQMGVDQFDEFNERMSVATLSDGSLDVASFLAIASDVLTPETEGGPSQTILKRIFARFDRESVGTVALEEISVGFSAMFGASGDDAEGAAVDVIFDLYDTDHSGGLDAKELEDYLLSVLMMSESIKEDGVVRTSEVALAKQADTLARAVRLLRDRPCSMIHAFAHPRARACVTDSPPLSPILPRDPRP